MNDYAFAHWAIVLQPGSVPVKKRLPKYADQQVPVLRDLMKEYPTALLAVVDVCGAEITVWSPEDVAAMALQFTRQDSLSTPFT
jgi:hypothetical protein